jgi:Peptidase inhibitor I78 family
MRNAFLFGPVLLCACSTAPANAVEGGPIQATPIHGETPGHTCQTAGTDRFIGQPGTSATGKAILGATHAAVLRWAPPGYMLTMDFRADRATVYLGPDNKITKISCS